MANGSRVTNSGRNVMLYRTYTETANLSATQYLAPTKIKIGVNNGTPSLAATDLDDPIPIANGVINDAGDNTLTGSNGGANSTDNTTTYKPGGGVTDNTAQNLITDGIGSSATKTWAISNLASAGVVIDKTKYGGKWLYILDATTLAKFLASGTCLTLKLGSDSSNYFSLTKELTDLAVGWNWISTYPTLIEDLTETGTVGATIDYFEIEIITTAAGDEFIAGDVLYDLLRTWDYADIIVSFTSGFPTFDYTNQEVTIRTYIDATKANGFLINGLGEFNEDTTPLMTGEDTFDDESKSDTDEFSFLIKNRIREV